MVVVPEIVAKETSEDILIYIASPLPLFLTHLCQTVQNQTVSSGEAVCTCSAVVIYVKRAKII